MSQAREEVDGKVSCAADSRFGDQRAIHCAGRRIHRECEPDSRYIVERGAEPNAQRDNCCQEKQEQRAGNDEGSLADHRFRSGLIACH